MPTETRVSTSVSACLHGIINRKSLSLLFCLQERGMRNHQVLPVPTTPTAKAAHLSAEHEGVELVRGMAPPMRNAPGWWRTHLFLANYLCSMSRSHATFLEQSTMQEWK